MYYRARYYDPIAGRWISVDPIGFAGGDVNLYGYVGQNPVNGTDPTGLYVWGVNTGGSITKKGVKAGASTAILFDHLGNFAIVTTQEGGAGIGNSGGLFFNGVWGTFK